MQIITTPDGTQFTREPCTARVGNEVVQVQPYMQCAKCPASRAEHCNTVCNYCVSRPSSDKRVYFVIKRA